MFVTPQHKVKELRNEAGWNIVGGTMLCSELVDVGEVYMCRKERRGEEQREEQNGEESVGGGGRKGK